MCMSVCAWLFQICTVGAALWLHQLEDRATMPILFQRHQEMPTMYNREIYYTVRERKSHTQQANGDHVNLPSSTEISPIKSLAQLKPCDRRLRCYAPKVVFISI